MRLALFAFALLVTAASAEAQTAVVLSPGHPDLDMAAVAPESRVDGVRMLAPQEQYMGTVREDVILDGDVLSVLTSTVVGMAGPPARDSTRLAWPSLQPLTQTYEAEGQVGRIAFAPDSVSGTWGRVDAPAALAFGLERPVFAPAALPFVIRALPLDRTGYRAIVPLVSVKERFQEATLTISGPETLTLEDGSTLEVVAVDQSGGGGLTRGFPQRHYIDPVTRERVRTSLNAQGMSVQIDPLSADIAATVRPIRSRAQRPTVALVPGHPDLVVLETMLTQGAMEMRQVQPEVARYWSTMGTNQVEGGVATIVMTAEYLGTSATPRTLHDTTRVAWPSLAPLSHRRVTVTADGETAETLDFDGRHVTGVYGDAGQALDLDLAAPVFGPRSVSLVARALPFETGYLATMATFTADDRLQTHTLLVVGQETVATPDGPVSAWIVEHEGDGPLRHYAIDPDTRALISATYSPQPGTVVKTARL